MSDVTRRTVLAAAAGSASARRGARGFSIRTFTCGSTTRHFPFAEGARVPERDATPETLLDLMKTNGVARTVIIQVIHYRYDNRYLAAVLKKYPGTFQGVCRVDPAGRRGARPSGEAHRRRVSAACV